MKSIILILIGSVLVAQTAQVQIIHNSPSPAVDIYVDGELSVQDFTYRSSTEVVDLPLNTVVGIAPTGGEIIAEFPFTLEQSMDYVVVASGILNDETNPFTLLASTLEQEAEDDETFALKVLHGVTDAPAIDVYADGELVIENLAYGEFTEYLQVSAGDYTLDITAHGSLEPVAAFSAPLASFGGLSGIVYASGFLSPTATDSAFSLVLTTPIGYTVQLQGVAVSELAIFDNAVQAPTEFSLNQNYPNPFNPSTSISYDLAKDAIVTITIYDLMGRSIKTLVDNKQIAGSRSVRWDATNNVGQPIPAGMYVYSIQADDFRQTKKMILLK